jgi:hypothetical protein
MLGQYQMAAQMHQQTLKLPEKVLRKDDAHTLASMNNLTIALNLS